MLKIYNTDKETNKIEEIKEFQKGSWISLVNPSEIEIKKVCDNVKIQEDFIRDALDFEEKASEIFEMFLGDPNYLSVLENAGAGYGQVSLGE